MQALADIFVAGGAALYLWVLASQLHTPILRPIQKWLRTERPTRASRFKVDLVSCPWCSGFWLSAILVLALQHARLDPILTPLSIFAAAALCGFVGALTPGADLEEIED